MKVYLSTQEECQDLFTALEENSSIEELRIYVDDGIARNHIFQTVLFSHISQMHALKRLEIQARLESDVGIFLELLPKSLEELSFQVDDEFCFSYITHLPKLKDLELMLNSSQVDIFFDSLYTLNEFSITFMDQPWADMYVHNTWGYSRLEDLFWCVNPETRIFCPSQKYLGVHMLG